MEQEVVANGSEKVSLLHAYDEEHGGVIVEMEQPIEPCIFRNMLRASLSQWKLQGKKVVWIKLPIDLVSLAETAVKEGFWYHHAEPEYLMLVNWIPETANTIPANATHRVRIGAVLMNDKRELLVVKEKFGRFWKTGMWKIPTGILDEGEDIFAGAVREVKEETGIDAEFIDVVAFRQMHNSFFGKSDLVFLCVLRPLSFDIQKQDSEIEAAQWMPYEEYAAQPFTKEHCIYKYVGDVCSRKLNGGYTGFTPLPITSFFNDQISYLYLNKQDLKTQNSRSS